MITRITHLFLILACLIAAITQISAASKEGLESLQQGQKLLQQGLYQEASILLWKAVLLHGESGNAYDAQEVFTQFMQCYMVQDRLADGLAFVASESFRRQQITMGHQYLQQALQVDPNNEFALQVQQEFVLKSSDNGGDGANAGTRKSKNAASNNKQTPDVDRNKDLVGLSPEDLYERGSIEFSNKNYEECADLFELSCQRSMQKLGPSCANAVYCRTMICDWGFNGTQYDQDMQRIDDLTRRETLDYRYASTQTWAWRRATSVHPHMMLGYLNVDPMLKRYVSESVAYLDEPMARAALAPDQPASSDGLPSLPAGMPYSVDESREYFQNRANNNRDINSKIKVGFVGCGFNSKAVLYLSKDMFRFFDHERFEIHIFSFGPPDNPLFIQRGMRGVDWREEVKTNADHFHDVQDMKMDHVKAAQYIHSQQIQILIEWDGYARQGERAQGLFALRPAPIQILHQEYLGTSGAQYVDYLFTDVNTSPPHLQHLYTEKLIYLPNHFFSKGHAFQKEVNPPSYTYKKKEMSYKLGTGSPQENRCLSPHHVGPKKLSFVFCNFNKFLKNNPETVRSWISILRKVPDSIICLLENPTMGQVYLRRFIHEVAGFSENNSSATFTANDGDELNDRIHFLPWLNNPFDHQQRNFDFCNVMLDSFPYNGHTVAQDALYAGIPIVTRSDGQDMASRVSTSANIVLDLEELNALNGPKQYEDIAIKLGTNSTHFTNIREKLIDSALQRDPMHLYWDVTQYVKHFELALETVWDRFMTNADRDHIWVPKDAECVDNKE